MSYLYAEQRSNIFTEDGQIVFLKIRDNAKKLIDLSGAATLGKIISGVTGDTWVMQACVDRLVEIGELIEVPNPAHGWGQYRIFTRKVE